jgi:peptidoglycan/xylan/chitin deacetylase (PgdA/CDA1 family)
MKKTAVAFLLAAGISPLAHAANEPLATSVTHTYLVGNSLVRSITPTRLHELMAGEGIDFQFGSQLKGGFSLARHWDVLERGETIRYWESNKPEGDRFEPGRPDGDTLPKRFGSFLDAQKNHKWDVLVLQPYLYGIQEREKELEAIRKFLDYSIEHESAQQIYIYTSWLRRPILRERSGKPIGLGNLDFAGIWEGRAEPDTRRGRQPGHVVRKDYREFIRTINKEYAGKLDKPVLMIPFGDVMCELDKRLKAGKIPGLAALHDRDPERIPNWDPKLKHAAGANLLYADRSHPVAPPHLDGTIANYAMGLMFYAALTGDSPVGLSGEAYKLSDEHDAELIKVLQEAVWDVLRIHPHTGLTGKTRRAGARKREPAAKQAIAPLHKLKNGAISIARWKDDKTAAVSIFSSDGMIRSIKSQWTPRKPDVPYDGFHRLGKKYSIPFTFFLPPRALDEQTYVAASGVTPVAQPAGAMGTWADWKFMHEKGHEIASHTYSHADLRADKNDPSKLRVDHDPKYELRQAIVTIEKNIGVRPISINPAYGPPAERLRDLFRSFYPVVRGDQEDEVVAAQHEDTATAADLTGKLDNAVAEGKWLRVGGHGIRTERGRREEAVPDFKTNGKRWDGYRPVEYSVIEALCREIHARRDELFVASFGDAVRYLKERNNSRFEIHEDNGNKIVFEVTHDLDPDVFDLPITLKLSLNDGASVKRITQAGKTLKLTQTGKSALVDVTPNGGEIVLRLE